MTGRHSLEGAQLQYRRVGSSGLGLRLLNTLPILAVVEAVWRLRRAAGCHAHPRRIGLESVEEGL